jgi:hypothetical protein
LLFKIFPFRLKIHFIYLKLWRHVLYLFYFFKFKTIFAFVFDILIYTFKWQINIFVILKIEFLIAVGYILKRCHFLIHHLKKELERRFNVKMFLFLEYLICCCFENLLFNSLPISTFRQRLNITIKTFYFIFF